MNQLLNNKKIILFDIDNTLFNTEVFKNSDFTDYEVYPEVYAVLKDLKDTYVLGILSQGIDEFQKEKLKKTKIYSFFSATDIHIVKDKKNDLFPILSSYTSKYVFFVDDKIEMLSIAKQINPQIYTIWVKRGEYAHTQKNIAQFTPNGIIDNLTEIKNITERIE